jgi:CRP/FNR family cyclic AMP-dependent transcriptional regulator
MNTDKSVDRRVGRRASSSPVPEEPSRGTDVSRRRTVGSKGEIGGGALSLLAAHPIFGALRDEDLRRLSAITASTVLKRGHVIFKKGDAGNSLYAIRSGSVKIAVPGADGREAMFNILGDGELFGEVALLDGQPRTADAVAITDCELVTLRRGDFLQLLHREPKVAIKIIELLCARLRAAGEHFEDILFLNTAERLAKTLLRLPYKALPSNTRRVTITQQEISQMIGLSRESTNKQLRIWEGRRWLKIVRGGVVLLDLDAITNAARHDTTALDDTPSKAK